MSDPQTTTWMDSRREDFDRWGWWLLGAVAAFFFWCWRNYDRI